MSSTRPRLERHPDPRGFVSASRVREPRKALLNCASVDRWRADTQSSDRSARLGSKRSALHRPVGFGRRGGCAFEPESCPPSSTGAAAHAGTTAAALANLDELRQMFDRTLRIGNCYRAPSQARRWRAAQVGGEAERMGRESSRPTPSRKTGNIGRWPSSSRSGTSGCLSGDGARRPVCSADCYRVAVGEKGGGPRMVIPRGFAVADAWRRARSTRSAVSSVAGSLAPR